VTLRRRSPCARLPLRYWLGSDPSLWPTLTCLRCLRSSLSTPRRESPVSHEELDFDSSKRRRPTRPHARGAITPSCSDLRWQCRGALTYARSHRRGTRYRTIGRAARCLPHHGARARSGRVGVNHTQRPPPCEQGPRSAVWKRHTGSRNYRRGFGESGACGWHSWWPARGRLDVSAVGRADILLDVLVQVRHFPPTLHLQVSSAVRGFGLLLGRRRARHVHCPGTARPRSATTARR
jgi:hypothetical protein